VDFRCLCLPQGVASDFRGREGVIDGRSWWIRTAIASAMLVWALGAAVFVAIHAVLRRRRFAVPGRPRRASPTGTPSRSLLSLLPLPPSNWSASRGTAKGELPGRRLSGHRSGSRSTWRPRGGGD
jgi:hypothetical protein